MTFHAKRHFGDEARGFRFRLLAAVPLMPQGDSAGRCGREMGTSSLTNRFSSVRLAFRCGRRPQPSLDHNSN